MKLLTSAALAGALALTAVGATATTADADAYFYYGYGPSPWYPGAGFAAFGMGISNLIAPSPYYPPYPPLLPPLSAYDSPGYSGEHILWCEGRYPNSYNRLTNMWVDAWGYARPCVSPYPY